MMPRSAASAAATSSLGRIVRFVGFSDEACRSHSVARASKARAAGADGPATLTLSKNVTIELQNELWLCVGGDGLEREGVKEGPEGVLLFNTARGENLGRLIWRVMQGHP
jgi:hypothetical protein